jgi:hypothetical protein
MWKTSWIAGSYLAHDESLLVSVTDFEVDRFIDLPRVYLAGWALSRSWPELDGAVGTWLWTKPLRRRCGSVSVWRSEIDLRAFVAWAPHQAIVREFAGRGTMTPSSWTVTGLARRQIWTEAARRLNA